ncbi:hypothetical protein HDU67_005618, partial [Dinochytrium kinnereticum]
MSIQTITKERESGHTEHVVAPKHFGLVVETRIVSGVGYHQPECKGEIFVSVGIRIKSLGSLTIGAITWCMKMTQKRSDEKRKKLVLSRKSVLKDFEEWKDDVTIALNAEPVPKDCLLILQTSEQMFGEPGVVDAPKQQDYKRQSTVEANRRDDDIPAYRKAMQLFNSKETTHLGWKALVKEIAYKQKNRAATLEQELMNFAQEPAESNVKYAEGMRELVLRFAAVGVPDPKKQDIVYEFNLKIASKFLGGLEEENRKLLRPMFRAIHVEEKFDSMREELITMETEDMLAAGQRKRVDATNAQRALSAQQSVE